jgi:hypothetical protein
MKKYLLIILLAILFASCTDNQRARKFGGKETIKLAEGQKLINATWKDSDLWFLTRPMTDKDSCQTYTFYEQSSWGVWEGTITIIEGK